MMTKPVVSNRIVEKRNKWTTFEQLTDTNETLDQAICILDDLKVLITQLPDKLPFSLEHADALIRSVMTLDDILDKCLESAGIHFDEMELKLDEMQKSLLYEEACNTQSFSKLASEVRYSQKIVDTLIANAEEEIYRFLESEGLYEERRKMDVKIMELVLNI